MESQATTEQALVYVEAKAALLFSQSLILLQVEKSCLSL